MWSVIRFFSSTVPTLVLLLSFSSHASFELYQELTGKLELPYRVTLDSTKDNQLQCNNCGGNGKSVLVQSAGDIRDYNFLMDTPYYLFLAQKETSPCPYTTWVAIKKTNAVPYASRFTTGCYPLKDFRSVHDKDTTKFTFYFLSGVSETIEFNNK
ncbi:MULTISPECIES: hypothetical protein [unclassified Serratia (in: enterobacteria)]|uniref:hypothetical protein n=1 Tax=unclassified Serratia (in: enterobacteria) TaxID=2647522 RepID=UPI002ED59A3E|nr:hypothetical protein [Serratia sp. C2(2)]MEE4448114.1 hypothetical protein [Serratia sp. C2(1)]